VNIPFPIIYNVILFILIMQVIRIFPILVMFVFPFLSGCTHDDDSSDGYSDISVQFTAQSPSSSSLPAWQQVNVPLDGSASTSSSSASTRGFVVSDTEVPAGNVGMLGYVLSGGTWSSSLTPSFMYNIPITRQGTGSNYTYQYAPTKYWPSNASDLVKFFAYYPYQGNGITLSNSTDTGYPSITYIPSTAVSDQVDLMSASPSACNNKSGINAVGLTFSHALTRISFSVQCSSYSTITVQSISLSGIKSKGTFSYNPSVISSPWTLSSLATDTTTYKVSTSDGTLIPEASQALNASAYQNITSYMGNLLLLPQSVTSANTLVVKYTVDGVSNTSTLSIPSATWAMGQSINYQLKLGLINSNCYIVNPSSTSAVALNIPLNRVNEFWGNASYGNDPTYVIGSGDAWTANIIWEDVPGLVTLTQNSGMGSSGKITVSVPAGSISGNAVIGVKKTGTTGYAWSWHVWVTGYDPNTTNSTIGSYTFMNYNLGTTSTTPGEAYKGLYYQWGRKDPFPQTCSITSNVQESIYGSVTSITNTPVAAVNNLPNSVQNPATFYYGVNDWYTSSSSLSDQNNGLWGLAKTIYDPCPQGWKVMSMAAYSLFSKSTMTYTSENYGWTDKSSDTFWSLSGGLRYYDGACYDVSANGYDWSVDAISNRARAFNISYTYVDSSIFSIIRASGFPVRCVRDN